MKEKLLKRKVDFLKWFLVFALQEQNKYIKINERKEIENYNTIIMKVLSDIKTLENKLQNLYIAKNL
jgi:hypothetical protein